MNMWRHVHVVCFPFSAFLTRVVLHIFSRTGWIPYVVRVILVKPTSSISRVTPIQPRICLVLAYSVHIGCCQPSYHIGYWVSCIWIWIADGLLASFITCLWCRICNISTAMCVSVAKLAKWDVWFQQSAWRNMVKLTVDTSNFKITEQFV